MPEKRSAWDLQILDTQTDQAHVINHVQRSQKLWERTRDIYRLEDEGDGSRRSHSLRQGTPINQPVLTVCRHHANLQHRHTRTISITDTRTFSDMGLRWELSSSGCMTGHAPLPSGRLSRRTCTMPTTSLL